MRVLYFMPQFVLFQLLIYSTEPVLINETNRQNYYNLQHTTEHNAEFLTLDEWIKTTLFHHGSKSPKIDQKNQSYAGVITPTPVLNKKKETEFHTTPDATQKYGLNHQNNTNSDDILDIGSTITSKENTESTDLHQLYFPDVTSSLFSTHVQTTHQSVLFNGTNGQYEYDLKHVDENTFAWEEWIKTTIFHHHNKSCKTDKKNRTYLGEIMPTPVFSTPDPTQKHGHDHRNKTTGDVTLDISSTITKIQHDKSSNSHHPSLQGFAKFSNRNDQTTLQIMHSGKSHYNDDHLVNITNKEGRDQTLSREKNDEEMAYSSSVNKSKHELHDKIMRLSYAQHMHTKNAPTGDSVSPAVSDQPDFTRTAPAPQHFSSSLKKLGIGSVVKNDPEIIRMGYDEENVNSVKPNSLELINEKSLANFDHEMQLDSNGKYKIYWTLTDDRIIFEVHVKTKGWVGFGVSPTGGMYPADLVIGWVTDGRASFSDYYTESNTVPKRDDIQDWMLLHGEENEIGTVLRFTRLLDTCDENHDIKIGNSTTVLVFAYHEEDPKDENSIMYHGTSMRGSVEILLSNPGKEKPLSPDVKSFDFRYSNITLPETDTYYHCEIIKFPELSQIHHIIGYEAVFTPGNKRFVHHSVLYECEGLDDSFKGYSFDCLEEIIFVRLCFGHYFVSALNSLPVFFPKHVGLSIGGESDPKLFLLQTHFSNPEGVAGVVDRSGFRAYYTPVLRDNTAQMMIAGALPERNFFFIPPHFQSFHATGYCMPDCLQKGMGNDIDEIRLVWIGHHTHLMGRGMTTRHIRNGVELKPIAEHPIFNFNFQVHQILDPEPVIRKTDMIQVDCTYDSNDRSTMSNGGFGTREEMCMSFIMYYPKISLGQCYSGPIYNQISNSRWVVRSTFNVWDFTNATVRQRFQNLTDESDHHYYCGGSNAGEIWERTTKPKITKPYRKPPSDCKTT